MNELAKILITWWKEQNFDYPWRKTKNPFLILSFEIFLQRTKVTQVKKIFPIFLKEFNSPEKVLKNKEKVISLLARLGLKHRALRYIEMCKVLVNKYKGRVPSSREDLLSLPGVGNYISSAFLNFYCKKHVVVIDRNVSRFIMRYFGISVRTSKPEQSKTIQKIVRELLPRNIFREASWALLDFSINICKPKPLCERCPLVKNCKWKTC